MRKIGIVCLGFIAGIQLLLAGDVTGKWSGSSSDGPDFKFTLKSDKDAVSGTMTGEDGKEYAVNGGKLTGDEISFKVDSEYQGNPITLIVKGKVTGENMQIHIETADGNWGTDATLHRQS